MKKRAELYEMLTEREMEILLLIAKVTLTKKLLAPLISLLKLLNTRK